MIILSSRKVIVVLVITCLLHYAMAFELPLSRSRPGATPRINNNADRILKMEHNNHSTSNTSTACLAQVNASKASNDQDFSLSYYLIWSPKVLKRLLFFFAISALIARFVPLSTATGFLSGYGVKTQSKLLRGSIDVALLLLSSACCGVQLLINSVVSASGCAGFNKHLGPIRPLFLGILLASLPRSKSWTWTTLQLIMALLPEIVHGLNIMKARRLSAKLANMQPSSMQFPAEIKLAIPQMGCVACIDKINASLRQVTCVERTEAWLEDKGGKAKIKLRAESIEDASRIGAVLVDQVTQAGFDNCVIEEIDVATK